MLTSSSHLNSENYSFQEAIARELIILKSKQP
jgi:hypothetical protein